MKPPVARLPGIDGLTILMCVDVRSMLRNVAELEYTYEHGSDQPAQMHLRQVRRELAELAPPGMRILVSGSAQNLPVVPWIAIVDRDITTTAKKGLYLVYLFSRDLRRVYLSMNQGATHHEDMAKATGLIGAAAQNAAISELHKESHYIQSGLSKDALQDLVPIIQLGDSKRFLPRAYEAGNIAAVAYDTAQLPTDAVVRADLDRMLALYASCVEVKRHILATDPGLIGTAAEMDTSRLLFTPKAPAFRPKSSADYNVHVAAQSQVRTRRHEALITIFGQWVRAQGFVANTNVHPCDLTVSQGDQHWLVEAKTVGQNAEHAVRDAIGQLFSYRHFVYLTSGKDAPRLVALFSEPIGAAFADLLVSLGIEAIWRTDGQWDGRADQARGSLRLAIN